MTPAVMDDLIDDVGMDSFPASDPPSWWAGTPKGPDEDNPAPAAPDDN